MLGIFDRRTFCQAAAMWIGSTGLSRARGQAPGPRGAPAAPWRGTVLQLDEGEYLISGRRRAPMRIKIDSTRAAGARMSMVISEVAPGASIPVHRHRNEDELIFIHTGRGTVTLGDERIDSTAGAVLYAPIGVWHGIENTGAETLTWCAVFSPAGFEQYFREVGVPPDGSVAPPSPDQVTAIGLKYGMEFRTP